MEFRLFYWFTCAISLLQFSHFCICMLTVWHIDTRRLENQIKEFLRNILLTWCSVHFILCRRWCDNVVEKRRWNFPRATKTHTHERARARTRIYIHSHSYTFTRHQCPKFHRRCPKTNNTTRWKLATMMATTTTTTLVTVTVETSREHTALFILSFFKWIFVAFTRTRNVYVWVSVSDWMNESVCVCV